MPDKSRFETIRNRNLSNVEELYKKGKISKSIYDDFFYLVNRVQEQDKEIEQLKKKLNLYENNS